jgi:tetratricopeptide (TPR) repeat protein/predicted Ser/Thr protein kinase
VTPPGPPSGNRLERALEVLLSHPPSTRAERDALLQEHPDLAEVLQPMLDGAAGTEEDPASTRVLGDFRLLRELGRGGMGVVYEAWQRSLDRRVAVKVLAPGLVSDPGAVARFRREATSAGRLRHPNLVEIHGFGSEDGEHFIAMQFVDGRPLHDAVERFRAPLAAVQLAAQLADALAHVHAAGLVHRDVKPGNVLVRADGHALLTDFGVARDQSLPTLTREGGFLGTVHYAAPEQLRGEPVDARSDVWAVGVILHELLTGSHPFAAPTEAAVLQRILHSEPAGLRGRPGISDDLAAVVGHALAKDPRQRYPTAAALLHDLRALLAGEPVSARLPSRSERLRRWARREPWRAVAAAVLVLGVPTLAGTVGYLLANAPRIEAALAGERARHRESVLATAFAHLIEGDPAPGLAALAPLDAAADLEVAALRSQLLLRQGDAAAARKALHGHAGDFAELARAAIDSVRPGSEMLRHEPTTEVEAFVHTLILYNAAIFRGARARPLLRRAAEMGQRAALLAPQPRLHHFAVVLLIADGLEDEATLRETALVMARHFPNDVAALRVQAKCLARTEPVRALALLDQLAALPGGGSPDELSFRALALEHSGRLEEAERWNRQVLRADPDRAGTLTNLAQVLRKQRRADEAVPLLRRALELRPQSVSVWNALGLALRDAGQPDEARQAFEQALALRPDHFPAALNLGNLLLRQGDHAGAIAAFEAAAAADPTNVRAAANLGDALARVGRIEEALQWSLRAVSLAPGDFIPHYNVASLALDLGLPRMALPFAARARELGKGRPEGLTVYAKALLAQDPPDPAAALAAARAADQTATGRNVEPRLLLARALAASGDPAAAIAALEAARADPRFAAAEAQAEIDELLRSLRGQ